MSNLHYAIGVDIGGTKIEAASVDASGTILHRKLFPSNVKGGPAAVEADIASAVRTLQKETRFPISAIGIGMAGQINADTGVVLFAPNLQWHDVPLKDNLQKALQIPVYITNDVRAAAWGEWIYGAGKGCNDMVCLFVGTGVGGGIVSGGRMLEGNSNTAGELGHMTIDLHGRTCTCGNRGCLESIAGGWAITLAAQETIKANPALKTSILKHAGGQISQIKTMHVALAAHEGDPLALQIFDTALQGLIAGSISIVNALNPRKLIFGGGVIHGLPELVDKIKSGIKKQALAAATESLEVLIAKLPGNDAGILGASAFALNERRQHEKK